MEKYGFVYLWRDRKHKRYYIGSHWGTEDDGYVCSSRWMRKTYSRRPQDFKRKILARVHTNRKDLLEAEYNFLQRIKPHEFKTRYYNISSGKNGHWRAEDYEQDVKKRISEQTKKAMARPEVREKMLQSYATRDWSQSDETRAKRSESMKKTMVKKFPVEGRRVALEGQALTEHLRAKSKEMWTNRSEEEKAEINRKISKARDSKTPEEKAEIAKKISVGKAKSRDSASAKMKKLKWYNDGAVNRRFETPPSEEWKLGQLKRDKYPKRKYSWQ